MRKEGDPTGDADRAINVQRGLCGIAFDRQSLERFVIRKSKTVQPGNRWDQRPCDQTTISVARNWG